MAAAGSRFGWLLMRGTDGLARSALLSNQIILCQSFAGLTANGAQQASKAIAMAMCITPLLSGTVVSKMKCSLRVTVLLGSCFQLLGLGFVIYAVLLGPGGWFSANLLLTGLFVPYSLGHGMLLASGPVLALQGVAQDNRAAFMQAWFAALAAGGTAGTLMAAAMSAWHGYAVGLIVAMMVHAVGTAAVALDLFPGARFAIGLSPSAPAAADDASVTKVPVSNGTSAAIEEGQKEPVDKAKLPTLTVARLMPMVLLMPFYACHLQWRSAWFVQTQYMNGSVAGFQVPPCLLQTVERFGKMGAMLLLQWLWTPGAARAPPRSEEVPCEASRGGQGETEHAKLEGAHYGSTDAAVQMARGVAVPGHRASQLSPSKRLLRARLATGSLLAGVALAASAGIERVRRDMVPRQPHDPEISSMHIVWLLPQFMLLAVAGAFVFPAKTEWAADSPLLVGLSTMYQSLTAGLMAIVVSYLEDWIPNTTPNAGHYDLFFMMLAVPSILAAAGFMMLPEESWSEPL